MKILLTGGCGFIGANLALALRQSAHQVVCFDNLSRTGSELLSRRVQEYGCKFVRGDVRKPKDLEKVKTSFDLMIDCSADPSVLRGSKGADARFVIENNLMGSVHCFEFCRRRRIPVIFFSTARVYPYSTINRLRFRETVARYEYADRVPSITKQGVGTEFSLTGYRSLYGATKLASEQLLQEYSGLYGLPAVINRCGIIGGPWQLAKSDQGVFTYWMARHFFRKNLNYIGFGGKGKQVRDLLHIDDLTTLIKKQISRIEEFRGEVFNVGGSDFSNLSLFEATEWCRRMTGNKIRIGKEPKTRPADVKWMLLDNRRAEKEFGWRPQKKPEDIFGDTYRWMQQNEKDFKKIFTA